MTRSTSSPLAVLHDDREPCGCRVGAQPSANLKSVLTGTRPTTPFSALLVQAHPRSATLSAATECRGCGTLLIYRRACPDDAAVPWTTNRGSRMSRNRSPSTFALNTVATIQTPGTVIVHHDEAK